MRRGSMLLTWDVKEKFSRSSGHSMLEMITSAKTNKQTKPKNKNKTTTRQPQLTYIIRKRHLKWFGHVQRTDNTRVPLRLYRSLEPTHGQRKPGQTSHNMDGETSGETLTPLWYSLDGLSRKQSCNWSQLRIWSYFLRQATGADGHDAVW